MNRDSYRLQAIGLIMLLFLAMGLFSLEPTPGEDIEPGVVEVSGPAPERTNPLTVDEPALPPLDGMAAVYALESQIVNVYAQASSAVVNIETVSFSNRMFRGLVPQGGTGSGFVYDRNGHIVTNYHVVEGADELSVTFSNDRTYEAELIGTDSTNDLAVIKIDAGADLPDPLPLHNSDDVRVGQFVLAIGAPFGLDHTLTTGVVSALGRVIESPEEGRFIGEAIQTDAPINPGNSGGPLLDIRGRIVGVNSQIISPSRASAGVGFAVSSNTVRRVVPELIARGFYPHPWLGARMIPLTPASAQAFREAGMTVPTEEGLLVVEPFEGEAAETAGIRGGSRDVQIGPYRIALDGDIIVAVDGSPVSDYQDLSVYLETQTRVGEKVAITILRGGVEKTLPVLLTERPRAL